MITRFIAGAGGVALRGALALDPQQYSVTIFSTPGGPLLEEAEKAGFRVVQLEHMRPEISLREDPSALRELIGLLRRGDFDIVHTHSSKAGALGRFAAHRVGVPAIVHTFHGFPFHDFQFGPLRTTYIEIEKRLGRITDQFLAVGGAVAAQAVTLRIAPAERIRAIASAIELDIVPASDSTRATARRLIGVPDDALVVGTVGRLAPQKAPQDLVAAIEAMRRSNVICVWVGDGPLREEMSRLIERRNLTKQFLLLGERRDVSALLPAFDVFALPSLYEGLPCSVVEAMTCGIPVVATAVNAVPEVVVPGRTGLLVPAGAPKLLARALSYLLDHPAEGKRMSAAARTQLGDRFDPAVLGRDLAETYELALTSSARTFRKALRLVA
ncbi:MAG TPA: glycosyltransferase family 4 protein [Candidatus Dormibacteraeota bacterium]|nr:glycosyltransferase family 4 protein [Candidatus Dormibacteraeota bacterium]